MKKFKYYLPILFFVFIATNCPAANNFNNQAENLNAAINSSKAFNHYLEDAKALNQNQKPNPFLGDSSFVQKLAKNNDQIFDDALNRGKWQQTHFLAVGILQSLYFSTSIPSTSFFKIKLFDFRETRINVFQIDCCIIIITHPLFYFLIFWIFRII